MEHTGGRHFISEKKPATVQVHSSKPQNETAFSANPNTMFATEGGHDPTQPNWAAWARGANEVPQVWH
jgi:hypothetical protein